MTSIKIFLMFVPVLSFLLLGINFLLAPHKPYKEKKTPFECGYHSFLAQNRTQFTISFFVFGLLFLLFDLEIVLIYPYTTSSLFNGIFGLISVILFLLILTLGFVFELNKKALKIDTLQDKRTVVSKFIFSSNSNHISERIRNMVYLFICIVISCKYKIIFSVIVYLFKDTRLLSSYMYIDIIPKVCISLFGIVILVVMYRCFLGKLVDRNTILSAMFSSFCFTVAFYILFLLFSDYIVYAYVLGLQTLLLTGIAYSTDEVGLPNWGDTSDIVSHTHNDSHSHSHSNNVQQEGTPYYYGMDPRHYVVGPRNDYIPFDVQEAANERELSKNRLRVHDISPYTMDMSTTTAPYSFARGTRNLNQDTLFGANPARDKIRIQTICEKIAHGPNAFMDYEERLFLRHIMISAWPNDFNLMFGIKHKSGGCKFMHIDRIRELLLNLNIDDPAIKQRAKDFRCKANGHKCPYAPRIHDNVYIFDRYPAFYDTIGHIDVIKNLNFLRNGGYNAANTLLNNVNTPVNNVDTPINNVNTPLVNSNTPVNTLPLNNVNSPILSQASAEFSNSDAVSPAPSSVVSRAVSPAVSERNNNVTSPILSQANAPFNNSNVSGSNINEQGTISKDSNITSNISKRASSPSNNSDVMSNVAKRAKPLYKPNFFEEQDTEMDAPMFHPRSRTNSESSYTFSAEQAKTIDPTMLSSPTNYTSNNGSNRQG